MSSLWVYAQTVESCPPLPLRVPSVVVGPRSALGRLNKQVVILTSIDNREVPVITYDAATLNVNIIVICTIFYNPSQLFT